MNAATLDALLVRYLSPLLCEMNCFQFRSGVFYRNLASGVRHIIYFETVGVSTSAFRAIAGFNSSAIVGEQDSVDAGVFGAWYISLAGLGRKAAAMPCPKPAVASASIESLLPIIQKEVIPWFDARSSNASIVDVIDDQYVFVKGKLLAADGLFDRARPYLEAHLARMQRMRSTPEVSAGIAETKRLLGG